MKKNLNYFKLYQIKFDSVVLPLNYNNLKLKKKIQ